MKASARIILVLAVGLLGLGLFLGFSTEARATSIYNSQVCRIDSLRFADFVYTNRLYNFSENRGCVYEINFMQNGTMTATSPVSFTGAAVDGAGVIIRGYPGRTGGHAAVNGFILDARGLGNCPIQFRDGSMDFMARMTIKVDNINKAICNTSGQALYTSVDENGHVTQSDAQRPTVTIYNTVTIQEDNLVVPPIPVCTLTKTASEGGGWDLHWAARSATSATLTATTANDGSTTISTDLNSSDEGLHVAPEVDTTYTLTAHGPGGNCVPAVVVVPAPPPPTTDPNDTDGDGEDNNLDNCPSLDASPTCAAVLAGSFSGDGVAQPNCSQKLDYDGDGKGNYCDDNNDIDGDGLIDTKDANPNTADADGDGVCDGSVPVDVVTQGYEVHCVAGPDLCPLNNHSVVEPCGGAVTVDTDPDHDGLTTDRETSLGTDPNNPDTDGDGFMDGPDDCFPTDPLKHLCIEAGSDPDPDHDGLTTDFENSIGTDPNNPDSDGDTFMDGPTDCFPTDPLKHFCMDLPPPPPDPDPDGDGLTTDLETSLGTDPNNADTDGDGFKDGAECFPRDASRQACTERNQVVIHDTDGDGICDIAESAVDPITNRPCTPNSLGQGDNCTFIPNPGQEDSDGDGDGDACPNGSSSGSESNNDDLDNDGLPDSLESGFYHTDPTKRDTDGDGLSDGEEVEGPTYQHGRGPLDCDVDADGICDGPNACNDSEGKPICTLNPDTGLADNCPIVENKDQHDSDTNGVGDACQDDMDGDKALDSEDNCPFIANGNQKDSDGDGIGDSCDPDADQGAAAGCGCRIHGDQAGDAGSLIPFLVMGLPMVFFRVARRKKRIAD